MGKVFFNDWELWQKMTFVLGCGIVLTIIGGLIKLQVDNYRIRKYSKVEKGKKAQTPEALEAQPVAVAENKESIPFGIRAIESGIEVDGVWISRSNTPVGSSRSSMTEIRLPRSLNNSQLELPKAVHGGSSSRDSSRAPSSAFDRAVSAERVPTNDSRSSSPIYDAYRTRPHAPTVASSSRHHPGLPSARNSGALQALEGYDQMAPSSRYEPTNSKANSSNSGKSGRSSDESDYMALQDRPYEAAYINPRHNLGVPHDPRTDLNLLQSHRLSHVAETGQLTPRTRRPGQSGEWASVADNGRAPQEISTSNGVDYFVPQQKTPSPPLAPVVSPGEDMAGHSMTSYTQDGHSSNHARQAVPLLETYAPQATYMPESYQPRGPQHQYEDDTAQYAAPQGHAQEGLYGTNVVRKVNSGFEILKPGTLGEPTSPEEEKPSPEKRQSKRLQKKRRSSASSNGRTSHFVEQV